MDGPWGIRPNRNPGGWPWQDEPGRIRPNRIPGKQPGRSRRDGPGRLQPNRRPGRSQLLGRQPGRPQQDEKPGGHRQGEALGRCRQGVEPGRRRQGEALGRRRQGEELGLRRQREELGRRKELGRCEELGQLRDGLLASRGLWNGLQALKGGRSLLPPPPPPFPRTGCRSFFSRHRGCCSFVSHNWGCSRFFSRHWRLCSFDSRHWRHCSFDSCHWRHCSFVGRHLGHSSLLCWGTSQEPRKLPKRQVIQPPHPPPVEGLIQGTIKKVLECCMVEPQPLCRVIELLGKLPYVSALLTEGAQGLKLEDALVEGAGQCGGWWRTVQTLPPLSPHDGGFVLSGTGEGRGRGPKCRRLKGFLFTKIKQTNKNYPVGEKQTGWLAGKAGQDTDDI